MSNIKIYTSKNVRKLSPLISIGPIYALNSIEPGICDITDWSACKLYGLSVICQVDFKMLGLGLINTVGANKK